MAAVAAVAAVLVPAAAVAMRAAGQRRGRWWRRGRWGRRRWQCMVVTAVVVMVVASRFQDCHVPPFAEI